MAGQRETRFAQLSPLRLPRNVLIVTHCHSTLPSFHQSQSQLRDRLPTPLWWLNHVVSQSIPNPELLDLVIRHDASITARDHVFCHIRSRHTRTHALHTDSLLFVRKTRDEACQCCLGGAVRTPAVVGYSRVAGGCEVDDFAETGVERMP
jgi:hypothetical protein